MSLITTYISSLEKVVFPRSTCAMACCHQDYPTAINVSYASSTSQKTRIFSTLFLQLYETVGRGGMYLSHSFVLTILPFLTAANPLVDPLTSRGNGGIAIPISKRAVHPLKYHSMVQKSVTYVSPLSPNLFRWQPTISLTGRSQWAWLRSRRILATRTPLQMVSRLRGSGTLVTSR